LSSGKSLKLDIRLRDLLVELKGVGCLMDYFHQGLRLRINSFEDRYLKKGLSLNNYQQDQ